MEKPRGRQRKAEPTQTDKENTRPRRKAKDDVNLKYIEDEDAQTDQKRSTRRGKKIPSETKVASPLTKMTEVMSNLNDNTEQEEAKIPNKPESGKPTKAKKPKAPKKPKTKKSSTVDDDTQQSAIDEEVLNRPSKELEEQISSEPDTSGEAKERKSNAHKAEKSKAKDFTSLDVAAHNLQDNNKNFVDFGCQTDSNVGSQSDFINLFKEGVKNLENQLDSKTNHIRESIAQELKLTNDSMMTSMADHLAKALESRITQELQKTQQVIADTLDKKLKDMQNTSEPKITKEMQTDMEPDKNAQDTDNFSDFEKELLLKKTETQTTMIRDLHDGLYQLRQNTDQELKDHKKLFLEVIARIYRDKPKSILVDLVLNRGNEAMLTLDEMKNISKTIAEDEILPCPVPNGEGGVCDVDPIVIKEEPGTSGNETFTIETES